MSAEPEEVLCAGCGGSGYAPPLFDHEGREYPSEPCDHCGGDGVDPLDPKELERILRGILTSILATIDPKESKR